MVQILEELGNAIKPETVSLVDILVAVALLGVALPTARFVERLVRRAVRRVHGLSSELVDLVANGSRYLTLFVLASAALNLVGVNIGWALGLALLFVVLLVLTLRPLVQNAAAGFVLRSRPSFAVGDEVDMEGHLGTVLTISARTTVLRTRDGRRVHIPNTDVLDHPIVVYTAFDARRVSIDLSVGLQNDLDLVTDLLIKAVSAIPEVRSEPTPRVVTTGLHRGAVDLAVEFWFAPHGHVERHVSDTVIRSIHSALRRAGIDLLPPRLEIHSSDRAS